MRVNLILMLKHFFKLQQLSTRWAWKWAVFCIFGFLWLKFTQPPLCLFAAFFEVFAFFWCWHATWKSAWKSSCGVFFKWQRIRNYKFTQSFRYSVTQSLGRGFFGGRWERLSVMNLFCPFKCTFVSLPFLHFHACFAFVAINSSHMSCNMAISVRAARVASHSRLYCLHICAFIAISVVIFFITHIHIYCSTTAIVVTLRANILLYLHTYSCTLTRECI